MSHFGIQGHQTFIAQALKDPSVAVRLAGARAISVWLDEYRAQLPVLPPAPNNDADPFGFSGIDAADGPFIETSVTSDGLLQAIGSLSGGDGDADVIPEAESSGIDATSLGDGDESASNAIDDPPSAPKPQAADPAVAAQIRAARKYDRWLASWRSSPEDVLNWLAGIKQPLEQLATSDDPETKAYGTLAAARLGASIEVAKLGNLIRYIPAASGRLVGLYPWLPMSDRVALLEVSGSFEDADSIVPDLLEQARRYDPEHYEESFWESLRKISIENLHSGWSLRRNVMLVATGREYFRFSDSEKSKPMAAKLAKRVAQFSEPIPRLLGLSVLGELDTAMVAELVGDSYLDRSTGDGLRRDFARFALASRGEPEAVDLSLTMLQDEVLLPVGLAYLAQGHEGVSSTEIGSIEVPSAIQDDASQGKLTVASVSSLVDADTLLPLLDHPDSDVVARATYTLIVLGEDVDLGPLERQARREGIDPYLGGTTDLLVKAIAFRNHDDDTAIIEEIYESMNKANSYLIRELYWKIRIMSGPQALQLRQRIRQEVGTSKLI